MKIDYNVRKIDYRDRIRNLDVVAQSQVKSNKFFPVFQIDGKEKIFKPLSKTKPLSTPYFAYSEVVWSTILHYFFDSTTPIYEFAIIENIEEEFKNKYHHGVLVDNLVSENENLINLYEYFMNHPDDAFKYTNYINYCCKFYDFQWIYDTEFMKNNPKIAESLSFQILLSILKCDQNYHYENPLFKSANGKITDVAPMIDHEFSSMFLYLDDINFNKIHFEEAITSLSLSNISDIKDVSSIFAQLKYEAFGILSKNLNAVLKNFPDMSYQFLEKLRIFLGHIKSNPIVLENKGYLVPFNSLNYKIGEQLYKKHNLEEAERLRKEEIVEQFNPNIDNISKIVNYEILFFSEFLHNEMIRRLEKL